MRENWYRAKIRLRENILEKFVKMLINVRKLNHWCNEEKAKEMLKCILIPYVESQTKKLGLRKNQPWLLVADVFKAQWTDDVKSLVPLMGKWLRSKTTLPTSSSL